MTREESIDRIKDMHSHMLFSEDREALETLIPELAESEDEKIVNWLIRLINTGRYRELESDPIPCLRGKMIAYLEKQKEQKPKRERKKPKESWLEKSKYELAHEEELLIKRQKELSEIRELKNKEQKPQLYWHKIKAYEKLPCKAYIYKFAYEQENNFHGKATIHGCLIPNEPVTIGCDTWYLPMEDIKNLPKEDELDITSPTKIVEQKPTVTHGETYHVDTLGTQQVIAGKMPQKPAEWSEEDEEVMEDLYNFVISGFIQDNIHETRWKPWKTTLEKNRQNRLKSLRPSWRPSEEQMDVMKEAVMYFGDSWISSKHKILLGLYEQLKKLGVKEEPEYYQHFDPDC